MGRRVSKPHQAVAKHLRKLVSDPMYMAIIGLTLGIWHNLALLALWWIASREGWQVLVDFNTVGEPVLEGAIGHASLVILVIALVTVAVVKKREIRRTRKNSTVGQRKNAPT